MECRQTQRQTNRLIYLFQNLEVHQNQKYIRYFQNKIKCKPLFYFLFEIFFAPFNYLVIWDPIYKSLFCRYKKWTCIKITFSTPNWILAIYPHTISFPHQVWIWNARSHTSKKLLISANYVYIMQNNNLKTWNILLINR